MNRLLDYVDTLPKKLIPAIAIVMVIIVAYLDDISGFELTFSVFYLLPILLVVWFGKTTHAVVISIVSALVSLWIDLASEHPFSHPAIPVWNALMLLAIFLIIVFALSEIKVLLEKERLSARVDFVTGALNGRAFHEIARAEAMRADRHMHPLTLAYLDVDNFKQVNDSLGHSIGDSVLRSVTDAIRHNIRSSDIVARLGGDEFAILLPETDRDHAKQAIDKVQSMLLAAVSQHNWPVTFSIGVVSCHKPCKVDELIKMADALMYTVKNSGKNGVVYHIYDTPDPLTHQAMVQTADATQRSGHGQR